MSAKRILSKEQVAEIKSDLKNMTQLEVARKWNFSQGTASNIKRGVYFRKHKELYSVNKPSVIVVHDPAEEGAFPKGAVFSRTEIELMLKDNVFTPGTRLKIKTDRGKLKAGNYIIKITSKMVKCD